MKKIGFIDYCIDNWHSANYPKFIRESSLGDRFQVILAWEKSHLEGKKPLDQWCREQGVNPAGSARQVIDQCDAIIVLSPNNPEMHEELTDLPLRSGKPVYVDKTFAPTRAAARRMIDKAARHGTPMFSSSALRFDTQLAKAMAGPFQGGRARYVAVTGGGMSFQNYLIHQVEMLTPVLGLGAKRLMNCGNPQCQNLVLDYGDGRRASLHQAPSLPFVLSGIDQEGKLHVVNQLGDYFPRLMDAMLRFFEDRKSPVPPEQTLEIAGIVETAVASLAAPDQWLDIPQA